MGGDFLRGKLPWGRGQRRFGTERTDLSKTTMVKWGHEMRTGEFFYSSMAVIVTIGLSVLVSNSKLEASIKKELVENGSFDVLREDGLPAGFVNASEDKSKYMADGTVSRSGKYSLLLEGDGKSRAGLSHRVQLLGGKTYSFSVWFRSPDLLHYGWGGHGPLQARLQLRQDDIVSWEDDWIDPVNSGVGYSVTVGGSRHHLLSIRPTPEVRSREQDGWYELGVTFTLPPDHDSTLIINLFNDQGPYPVWFDDLSVIETERSGSDHLPPPEESKTEWRSSLYPEFWTPCYADSSGRFFQDFSFAGYHGGLRSLPVNHYSAMVDVTQAPYFADSSGQSDATEAIQSAIDHVGRSGGGTVYIPPGIYVLEVPEDRSFALGIRYNNVSLIGAGPGTTFLELHSDHMRNKDIIRVFGEGDWWRPTGGSQLISEPLTYPTQMIPLDGPPRFKPGEWVVITHDTTAQWISEHYMDDLWPADSIRGATFYREVIDVNHDNNTIIIDAPIRYYLMPRDKARVYKVNSHVEEVGISDLSIGMREHGGDGWLDEDFNVPGTGGYDVHASHAIRFVHAVNSWVFNVASYKPAGNERAHLLSNGILLYHSRFITLDQVTLKEPQYRGAGGNGYHFTLKGNDSIIKNSKAYNARHNYDFGQAHANGNVISQSHAYGPVGLRSDFHMHLSPSNLIDSMVLDQDRFDAGWRGAGTLTHGLTTTQTIFWNTKGDAYKPGYPGIVFSEQYGWGYVIGTRGEAHTVRLGRNPRTLPEDFIEGIGHGAHLTPQSLYLDQLQRRVDRREIIHCPDLDFRPPVPRITIREPASGGRVYGVILFDVDVKEPNTGEKLVDVVIKMDDTVVYRGQSGPDQLEIDTRDMREGQHTFTVEASLNNGLSSRQSGVFVVANTWKLTDHLDAPIESPWFGSLPQHKTIDTSDGWTYDTSDKDSFFGDGSRRVRVQDTKEYLVWESPHLDEFTVVLYSCMHCLTDLVRLDVADGGSWIELDFDMNRTDPSSSGWYRMVLSGHVPNDVKSDRFRLTLLPGMGKTNQIQVGEVELRGFNK